MQDELGRSFQLVTGSIPHQRDVTGSNLSQVVIDETVLIETGAPSPLIGQPYATNSFTRVLGAGPLGRFFIHDEIGSTWVSPRALIEGPGLTPLLLPGDPAPGVGIPIVTVRSAASAPRAEHWAAIVQLQNASADDTLLVVDGTAPTVQGNYVRINGQIEANGNPNERWSHLYDAAVSGTGSWAVRGRSVGGSVNRHVIVRDGEVVMRTNDIVDGLRLTNSPNWVGFGADGSLLTIWSAQLGTEPSVLTLFVDDRAVLRTGDPIDRDGDGTADPGWAMWSFPSTAIFQTHRYPAEVDVDEDGVLRAAVELMTPNSTGEAALVEIRPNLGEVACQALPNSTGLPAELVGAGTTSVAANAFELRASQLPPGRFGYFLTATSMGFGNPQQMNLCVSGSVGRVLASTGAASATGTLEHTLDLTALPQPVGPVAVLPGDTWYFQCWFREVGGANDFSSGLAVTFR